MRLVYNRAEFLCPYRGRFLQLNIPLVPFVRLVTALLKHDSRVLATESVTLHTLIGIGYLLHRL